MMDHIVDRYSKLKTISKNKISSGRGYWVNTFYKEISMEYRNYYLIHSLLSRPTEQGCRNLHTKKLQDHKELVE